MTPADAVGRTAMHETITHGGQGSRITPRLRITGADCGDPIGTASDVYSLDRAVRAVASVCALLRCNEDSGGGALPSLRAEPTCVVKSEVATDHGRCLQTPTERAISIFLPLPSGKLIKGGGREAPATIGGHGPMTCERHIARARAARQFEIGTARRVGASAQTGNRGRAAIVVGVPTRSGGWRRRRFADRNRRQVPAWRLALRVGTPPGQVGQARGGRARPRNK